MARYGTVGEARIVETDHLFLASYSIAVIRPDQRRITTRYLHWMIVSPDLQRQILSGVRGGIQADLGLKTIRELRIPVPPLPEQQKIVVYLDDLQQQTDALKALQAETSAELNALIPSILDKAFRGEL
jgi:type I restriction enzyme S subunit